MWGTTRFASSTPGVKRGFSACLYQGPRNWVMSGLLQGACQSLQCVPKKIARMRKAPEYGALLFLRFDFLLIRRVFQAGWTCAMLVHGALKRCTIPNLVENQMWERACSRRRCVSQCIC
ncbi:hypothetical protein B0A76_05160 [Pseudomonas fluorescens]|nr:hypothetical protein B0A76_05160 [Pseudomonas fluorescens]